MFDSLSLSIQLLKLQKWTKAKAQGKKLQQLYTCIGQWDREKTEPFQSKTCELGQSTGSLYWATLGNNTSQGPITADVEFTYITYTPLPKSPWLEGDTTTVSQNLGSKGQYITCEFFWSYFSEQFLKYISSQQKNNSKVF